jgi:hypothetical protein
MSGNISSSLTDATRTDMWLSVRARRTRQINSLSVAGLKRVCKLVNLKLSGKKADLAMRCISEMDLMYRSSSDRLGDRTNRLVALDNLKKMFSEIDNLCQTTRPAMAPTNPQQTEALNSFSASVMEAHQVPQEDANKPAGSFFYLTGKEGTSFVNALLQLGAKSAKELTSKPTKPSPPYALDLSLPATPLPQPLVFDSTRSISPYAGQFGHMSLDFHYNSQHQKFDRETRLSSDYYNTLERLSRYDLTRRLLFASATSEFPVLMETFLSVPIKSGSFKCPRMTASEHPSTVAHFKFVVPDVVKYLVMKNQPLPGIAVPERNPKFRFVLRALPTAHNKGGKGARKADVHTWPQDVEIYINTKYVSNIKQRKKVNNIWKGQCEPVDLTDGIYGNSENHLVVLCQDAESYVFQFALVEVKEADEITSEFLGKIEDRKLEKKESNRRAISYLNSQVVSVEGESAEGDEEAVGSDTVTTAYMSVNDPTSMQLIDIPVRGRECKHTQCYDLKYYMEMNSFNYVRRWFCPCCENVVSADNLIKCELFESFLERFNREEKGKANEDNMKSRVEFRSDGEWSLALQPSAASILNKKRRRGDPPHRGDSPHPPGGAGGRGGGDEGGGEPAPKRPTIDTTGIEIIEID